jgi:hypothetical protein
MQQAQSLLPSGRKRVKLTSRGEAMIPGFAIGNKLHNKNGNRAEQQDVDKPALVQEEFQDNPDDEEYCANCPHFEFP